MKASGSPAPIKSPCASSVVFDLARYQKLEREVRHAHNYAAVCANEWALKIDRLIAGGIANEAASTALASMATLPAASSVAMRGRLDRIRAELHRIIKETRAVLPALALQIAPVVHRIEPKTRRSARPSRRARLRAMPRAIRVALAANEAV